MHIYLPLIRAYLNPEFFLYLLLQLQLIVMDDKKEEFREMLKAPLSRGMIYIITDAIKEHPENFETVYQLIFDSDTTVSWRAGWVCEKLSEKHPDWFDGRQGQLTEKVINCPHDGTRRVLLSILYDLPVAKPFPVDLLDFSFEHMLDLNSPIAVQSLCVKMAYKLCLEEPELLPELKMYLETAETEYYSTGVRTCIRKVMQNLTHNKFSL